MKTKVWFAWLAVIAAVVTAVLLRLFVDAENWVLAAILTLVALPVGYIIGGAGNSEPEPPGETKQ